MTTNYTNKIFDTLWIKRLATLEDLCQYKQHTERGKLVVDSIVNKKQRHKYWYCQCTACQKVYVVSSDYVLKKTCKCRKK